MLPVLIIAGRHDDGCYDLSMIPEGTTERLILRPLKLADAKEIQEHFPHWEIVRFMLARVPWPYPPDGALGYCQREIPKLATGEVWHWSLNLRSNPARLIGLITLKRSEESNRGFWLGQPWQGQGLMSEACVWVNDFWFETLAQLPQLERQVVCFQCRHSEVFTTRLQIRGERGSPDRAVAAGWLDGLWGG